MIDVLKKFKDNKKFKIGLIAVLCLLTLFLYFLPTNSSNNAQPDISNNVESSYMSEEKLASVLKNIKGAGNVSVMITYENSSEIICADNVEKQTNTVTEKTENGGIKESETVIENKTPITIGSGSGENPLVVLEKEPEVKGVIVVAQGADKLDVRLNLQKAVETVLQISPDQVEIFTMN